MCDALRAAGHAEFGHPTGGFVVHTRGDGDDPILVCCTDDPDLDRLVEHHRYRPVLTEAGFVVRMGIDTADDNEGLRVWAAPTTWALPPARTGRELAEDWMRALTISHHPGITPTRALAEIAETNRPLSIPIPVRTRLPADDRAAIEAALARHRDTASRQAGVNLLVEGLLIEWLAEATGTDPEDLRGSCQMAPSTTYAYVRVLDASADELAAVMPTA